MISECARVVVHERHRSVVGNAAEVIVVGSALEHVPRVEEQRLRPRILEPRDQRGARGRSSDERTLRVLERRHVRVDVVGVDDQEGLRPGRP